MNSPNKIATLMAGALLALQFQTQPSAAADWQLAAMNPRFEAQRLQPGLTRIPATGGVPDHSLGYTPAPLQLPKVANRTERAMAESMLPRRFDLRGAGGVTPVRDQGQCGSCWAFATFGSLESYLKYSLRRRANFAEQDLNQDHGFDYAECEGGDAPMAIAYLARWDGPIAEADMPYPYIQSPIQAPVASGGAAGARRHIQDASFLSRDGFLDNAEIKQSVLEHGGVYVAFEFRDDSYEDRTASHYTDTESANHAVVIVGWDDDYPRNRFKTGRRPPGNGAFLIRNSWGSEFGDHGYFYLSYYDRSITELVAFHNAEKLANYRRVYQHDPLGWTNSIGVSSPPRQTGWFANVFTVAPNAPLIQAVSLYTPVPASRFTLSVFDRVKDQVIIVSNPTDGDLIHTQTGTIEKAGYHTVRLSKDLMLTANAKFSVAVKLTTPGYRYPVPVEARVAGYSSAANANLGQSFVSADGITWQDVNGAVGGALPDDLELANVALKAFGAAAKPD